MAVFPVFGTSGRFPVMVLEGSEIQPLLGVAPGSDNKLPLEVIGILAALNNKHNTGLGQHVDISMLDVSVALLANQGMNYLAKKQRQKRVGNNHPNVVPYQVMPAKDGDLFARNRQNCHIDRFPAVGPLEGSALHWVDSQQPTQFLKILPWIFVVVLIADAFSSIHFIIGFLGPSLYPGLCRYAHRANWKKTMCQATSF